MSTPVIGAIKHGKNPAEAWAMLTDPDYVVGKGTAQGALSVEAEVEEFDDGGAVIVSRRSLPAEVPAFARALVGQTIDLVETQTWSAPDASGGRSCELEVTFGSSPVTMSGTMRLEPNTVGCTVHLDALCTAKVPFIGGKVEALTRDQTLRAIETEEQFAQTWP